VGQISVKIPGQFSVTINNHVLNLAQAQIEPSVEPDNMSNDVERKPVALVADF